MQAGAGGSLLLMSNIRNRIAIASGVMIIAGIALSGCGGTKTVTTTKIVAAAP